MSAPKDRESEMCTGTVPDSGVQCSGSAAVSAGDDAAAAVAALMKLMELFPVGTQRPELQSDEMIVAVSNAAADAVVAEASCCLFLSLFFFALLPG